MAMRPANDKELLDHEQVDNYVRHIQDLYKMRGTACFRKMLIPETKPCTFSLNQIEEYPYMPRSLVAAGPYWQLTCHMSDDYGNPLEKVYYFTGDGRIRYYSDEHSGTIELDANEAFVSWERYDEVREDGGITCTYHYIYDEDGNQIEEEWLYDT